MIMRREIVLGVGLAIGAVAADAPSFDATRYLSHIKYLASPELKGRASGSPELEKAAKYIADAFKADGLQPVGGSYLEPFEVTTSSKLGKGNSLESTVGGDLETLQANCFFRRA